MFDQYVASRISEMIIGWLVVEFVDVFHSGGGGGFVDDHFEILNVGPPGIVFAAIRRMARVPLLGLRVGIA